MNQLKFMQHPLFLFLALPLFYMAFGCVYALQYHNFQPIPFILLYLFILINQIQELTLKRNFDAGKFNQKGLFLIGEIALIAVLIYFTRQYSWVALAFLILYSVFIQSNVLFRVYQLRLLPAVLTLMMNMVFMNGFACYTQAHFISLQALMIVIPQVLPFLILAVHQWNIELNRPLLAIILLFNTLFFIYSYYSLIGLWSMIILISLPFAYLLLKENTAESKTLYALIFGILGIICLAIRLFL